MDAPLVAIHALDLRFGPRAVLSRVDLLVGPGEVHGLLGPHRGGKSTLLRVLAGSLRADAGSVYVAEHRVLVAEDGTAALSPIEAQLSDATRCRIALARAVASEPDVLLVDEPLNGFDPETAAAARALIARHTARGGACVWATRRLDSLHGLASGVTLLAAGQVRYSGSVEALVLRALARSAEDRQHSLERAA